MNISREKETMPEEKEKKPESEAHKRWHRENAVVFSTRLIKSTDKDILDYLEGKQKQTEVKRGLRLLIAQEKENEGKEKKNK